MFHDLARETVKGRYDAERVRGNTLFASVCRRFLRVFEPASQRLKRTLQASDLSYGQVCDAGNTVPSDNAARRCTPTSIPMA